MKKAKKRAGKAVRVSFILDETGSMGPYLSQTLSGFNEYVDGLRDQKKLTMTLTKFNTNKINVVYKDKPIADVPKLTAESYDPMACTNLYDAIGRTLHALDKKTPTLVIIMTDGEENSSTEFTREKVFDLIKQYETAGFTFVYLGANQDAYGASGSLGIHTGNTVNYAQANTKAAFGVLRGQTQCYAANSGAQTSSFFNAGDNDKLTS